MKELIDKVNWNKDGLVAAIAQDVNSKQVLMMAWMSAEALIKTIESKSATYFSRSRGKIWVKGESSGHSQIVHDIRLDCDGDTILMQIQQIGGIACHTGREHCFFYQVDKENACWKEVEPVLKSPDQIY